MHTDLVASIVVFVLVALATKAIDKSGRMTWPRTVAFVAVLVVVHVAFTAYVWPRFP